MPSKGLLFAFGFPTVIILAILWANTTRKPSVNTAPVVAKTAEPAPKSTGNETFAGIDGGAPAQDDEPLARTIVKGETTVITFGDGKGELNNVTARNVEPAKDDGVSVSLGSVCNVVDNGTLTVIGLNDTRVLVRFRKATHVDPKKPSAEDTEEAQETDDIVACPGGTVFFLEKDEYLNVTEPSEADLVQLLLNEEKPAEKKTHRKTDPAKL